MAKNEVVTVTYLAWDTASNAPKTGDVANHTIRYIKDGVAAGPAASPAEVENGEYKIVIAAGENTGKMMAVEGSSSTAQVEIVKSSWQNVLDAGASAQQTRDAMKLAPSAGDPAAGSVDKHLDDIPTTGSGSVSWTINVKVSGNPIDGAEVRITSDEEGDTAVAGPKYTDANGDVDFLLDAGTYYAWVQRSGSDFSNPTTVTVV